jgi:hypothetical protein
MSHHPLSNRFELLERWALFLLFGYLLLGRSFAYIGVPPLFIGEASLAAYLVARPRSLLLPWLGSLASPQPLSGLAWCLALSLTLAAAQCARALLEENLTIATLQNAVFHVYPLFLFPGVYLGLRHPEALPRLVHVLAWCNALYGLAYLAVLSPLDLVGSVERPEEVPWFGQPSAGAAAILGLLAMSRRFSVSGPPLLLNLVVVLGMQRRAEWLSIFVGVALWTCLAGKLTRTLSIAATLAALLLLGVATDLKVPSPGTRGGQISARDIVARALASVDERAALKLSREAHFYAATAQWRSDWWQEIWKRSQSSPSLLVFGAGYQDLLWQLHPEDLGDNPVRTPHSIFMFILGYTGWVGLFVFSALQLALARLLWRAYRASENPFGFCYWSIVMVWTLCDAFLETPFEGIPTYLLLGIAAAPAVAAANSFARRATAPTTLGVGPREASS